MTDTSDNPGSSRPEAETPEVPPQVTELLASTGEILEHARESSVDTLREFTDLEIQPDQLFACFELFDGEDYGMGYNEFFATGVQEFEVEYNPFDDAGSSFLPELLVFLRSQSSVTSVLSDQKHSSLFVKYHREQLIKWFSECWIAAGGAKSQVPTYLAFGKEDQVHDLITGEAMSQAQAAQQHGYGSID